MILDGSDWVRHPWPEVLVRAENVAERLLDDGVGAVGLVGEPTVEFIASIVGAFVAGSAVSILPGPVRGADSGQWALSTVDRLKNIGVQRILSNGSYLERLRRRSSSRRC